MRYLLTAIMLLAAPPALAATSEQELELRLLEQRLIPLAMSLSGDTQSATVVAALGDVSSEVHHKCDEGCYEQTDMSGGTAVRYTAVFSRSAQTLTHDTYKLKQPFTGEGWELWLGIDMKAAPDLCFSKDAWNAALATAGWPRLREVPMEYSLLVEGALGFTKRREIDAPTFQSQNGDRRIKLSTATGLLMGGAVFEKVTTKEFEAAQALGNCLRMVEVDLW